MAEKKIKIGDGENEYITIPDQCPVGRKIISDLIAKSQSRREVYQSSWLDSMRCKVANWRSSLARFLF
jgi:hypothetical protein